MSKFLDRHRTTDQLTRARYTGCSEVDRNCLPTTTIRLGEIRCGSKLWIEQIFDTFLLELGQLRLPPIYQLWDRFAVDQCLVYPAVSSQTIEKFLVECQLAGMEFEGFAQEVENGRDRLKKPSVCDMELYTLTDNIFIFGKSGRERLEAEENSW